MISPISIAKMPHSAVSTPTISPNRPSASTPRSSFSCNSPRRRSFLLPLYASLEPRYSTRHRYRSLRHYDPGLSQMMMSHRGSILRTASLALIGDIRRASRTGSEIDHVLDVWEDDRLWSRTKKCVQYVYEKSRFKYFLPLIILLAYSFLGGAVVYWIESPTEKTDMAGKQMYLNNQKEGLVEKIWDIREQRLGEEQAVMNFRESVHWYTITTLWTHGNLTRLPPPTMEIVYRVGLLKKYTREMAERCWEIRLESFNRADVRRKLKGSLKLFELFTGVTTEVKPVWTFSNALFLAVTIYTTIGYGSVAPHTVAGRVATVIYAIIGIPVYLMILHKLGRVFLKLLHGLWNLVLKLAEYVKCFKKSISTKTSITNVDDSRLRTLGTLVGGKEIEYNIPLSLAVGVTFAWMLACAGICCVFFETSWDYFTSFYFFFISLTTIGFGDVTPTHPEYMFTMFGLIIVGLSLVSMCINVVQQKLEILFEEMMLALMEEYERSGRPLDGEIMQSALYQRGLGLVQMMKLWRRKRDAENAVDSIGNTPIPSSVTTLSRRRAFLREIRRRRRIRNVTTQTELGGGLREWQIWMASTLYRRKRKIVPKIDQSTQTDLSIPNIPITHDDDNGQMVEIQSDSSSMATCRDEKEEAVSNLIDDNENKLRIS